LLVKPGWSLVLIRLTVKFSVLLFRPPPVPWPAARLPSLNTMVAVSKVLGSSATLA